MKTIKHILNGIPDKRQDKNTTSLKFKNDVIDYFKDLKLKRCIEVGTNLGYSTRILSFLFEDVVTIENNMDNIYKAMANNKDRSNITYLHGDAYANEWGVQDSDASFIDCVHTYKAVTQDIEQSIGYNVQYLIFDDYGIDPEMKRAIDDFIKSKTGVDVVYIGEPAGSEPRIGKPLRDFEGVIVAL